MSEAQEKFLEELKTRNDRLRNTLIGIIISLLAIGVGQYFISAREQSKKNKETDEKIAVIASNVENMSAILKVVSKEFTPTWYMQGITDLYSLSFEKMIVVIYDDDKQTEILRINTELKQTIKIMQDQFIRMRGEIPIQPEVLKNQLKEAVNNGTICN